MCKNNLWILLQKRFGRSPLVHLQAIRSGHIFFSFCVCVIHRIVCFCLGRGRLPQRFARLVTRNLECADSLSPRPYLMFGSQPQPTEHPDKYIVMGCFIHRPGIVWKCTILFFFFFFFFVFVFFFVCQERRIALGLTLGPFDVSQSDSYRNKTYTPSPMAIS